MNSRHDAAATSVRLWLTRLVAMTVKELLQLFRDGFLMFAIILLFTVHIYLTRSIRFELNLATVVAHDADHSAASRELLYRFRPPQFQFGGEIADAREGIHMLDQGKALVVLDIPPQFERNLRQGNATDVQVLVDTSNTILGTLAAGYSAQIIGRYGQETAIKRVGQSAEAVANVPMIEDQHRIWYNANQNDQWFMPIAELLTVITILSIMLPAAAAVREKERGTIEQLLVSPLTPTLILLPKVISMTLVIVAGTAACLFLILVPAFHMPTQGSLPLFFAVTTIYTIATSGLGLYISTLSRNLAQAVMLSIFVLMPMLLLSGAWTPPEAMPVLLRNAMFLSPLYYYIEMSYGILLKGAGLGLLWDSLLSLMLLGTVIFGIGVWRFHRGFR